MMNKNEYMEILIDYLNQNVAEDEKIDILRDVEEMISEGVLSGKTESDVVSQLGSPKKLVRELKGEEAESMGLSDKVNTTDVKSDCKFKVENIVNLDKLKSIKFKDLKIVNIMEKLVKSAWKLMLVGMFAGLGTGFVMGSITMVIMMGLFILAAILMAGVDGAVMSGCIFAIILCLGCLLVGVDLSMMSYRKVRKYIREVLSKNEVRGV